MDFSTHCRILQSVIDINGTNGMKSLIDCFVGRLMIVEVENIVVGFDFYSKKREGGS